MEIEQKYINTMRKLALDQIANANSGHPGIALGIAPMLFAVYKNAKVYPNQSSWFDRDRIVLSCGHGSSVLYSALYQFGFHVSLDDLKEFRSFGSRTPGHPEVYVTDGVDASTGALGQGFAVGVGMAMAEAHLESFNRKNLEICSHHTFVLCGDGDLMEGISYEAAALAGNFKLNKLIALYDSNDITMTDKLCVTSAENTKQRFEAAGWNVLEVSDGENFRMIERAIMKAKKSKDRPTLIICKTTIGYGSKLENSPKCHGKPFSKEEVGEICLGLGVSTTPFEVEDEIFEFAKKINQNKQKMYENWCKTADSYENLYPNEFQQLFYDHESALVKHIQKMKFDEDLATREASSLILNALQEKSGVYFGGGADVAMSTMAYLKDEGNFSSKNRQAANIPFGVREHAMGAIANGIALHGGLRAFASTFLIFSDYMKYAIRQSALMELPVLYLFSHDSIYIGKDGPSHQPVEQTASLRLIPNLVVFRPADAYETVAGYEVALETRSPTALILSRQKLPLLSPKSKKSALFGGYILAAEEKKLDIILMASGSEVALCLEAKKLLKEIGIDARVVSIPCAELFLRQDKKYIASVLPAAKKLAITSGVSAEWRGLVGDGKIIGVDHFGESGDGQEILDMFGINAKNIIKNVKKILK